MTTPLSLDLRSRVPAAVASGSSHPEAAATPLHLPPLSPDFDPIEKAFATPKALPADGGRSWAHDDHVRLCIPGR